MYNMKHAAAVKALRARISEARKNHDPELAFLVDELCWLLKAAAAPKSVAR
jgi:hypothetical protein